MNSPARHYEKVVTAEAVRQMRDETGDGMMTCKRRLEKKALRQILCQSSCDPGIRFILTQLIEDMNP